MEELKQRLLALEHHSELFEQYYIDYFSNEVIDALVRIKMLMDNDNTSEYACLLGIIRNIEYLKTAI